MSRPPTTIRLSGIPFVSRPPAEVVDRVQELYERGDPAFIAHANVHTLNLATDDPGYADVLRRAAMVLNDGKGVMLGARLKGRRFPADLNGNHMGPLFLTRAAERGWPVFFFGAAPGVADRAAAKITSLLPDLDIVGVRNGFVAPDEMSGVVAEIRASEAGLLFVGLGNPRQERWLDENLAATGARVGIGVGAFFDFQAGEVKRAPEWMNRTGLEWVHRLALEPKRMWRRYLVGNPQFLARTWRERREVAPDDDRPQP